MKKFILFFALLTIATMANAQVTVLSNGNVGIGTSSTTSRLRVAGGGNYINIDPINQPGIGSNYGALTFWESTSKWNYIQSKGHSSVSDSSLKEAILPIENAMIILKKLKTYTYYFKADPIENRQKKYGVLAQEVETILPDLVSTAQMEDGLEYKLVNYDGFIPFLIKGFNEQQSLIEQQQNTIENLQKKLEALERCCSKGDSKNIEEFDLTGDNIENMKLYQNAPNPFNSITTIQCYIPQTIQKVQLCVYDMQGAQVKCLTLSERGTVDVQIQAGQLVAGIYTYLLVGDGKTSEAKQMILTK